MQQFLLGVLVALTPSMLVMVWFLWNAVDVENTSSGDRDSLL